MALSQRMEEVFDSFLLSLASEDQDTVLLYSGSASQLMGSFRQKRKSRCFDMGMAELDLISTAAGMALSGKKPWVLSKASRLLSRGYDAVRTAVAIPGLPVKMVSVYSGLSSGEDGAVSQILEDIALARSLPGVSVKVPCDGASALESMREMAASAGPSYLRLTGFPVEPIYDESVLDDSAFGTMPLSSGDGVTICSCGIMVHEALKASSLLHQQDITAQVIDCRNVQPLPERAILESVHRTGCCVAAEEHGSRGGLGEAVASFLSSNYPVPMKFVSVKGVPGDRKSVV